MTRRRRLVFGLIAAAILAVLVPASTLRADPGKVAVPIPNLPPSQELVTTGKTESGSLETAQGSFNSVRYVVLIGLGEETRQKAYWESDPGPGQKFGNFQFVGQANADGVTYYIYNVVAQ